MPRVWSASGILRFPFALQKPVKKPVNKTVGFGIAKKVRQPYGFGDYHGVRDFRTKVHFIKGKP